MDKVTCGDCRYHKSDEDQRFGKCLRHAPKVVAMDGKRPLTFFPSVIAGYPACGDFEAAPRGTDGRR